MKVYFVRHGEGHHNANNLYSLPDFELTEKGIGQAKAAAERVKHLPIELIVASPFKRTIQTMEIINEVIKKQVVLSELAVEVRRPTEIAGKKIDAPENMEIRKQLDANFHVEDYHFSDEENFFDLKNRASKFLEYLASFEGKHEHLLVVSHAVFIKMAVLCMVLQDALTPKAFLNAYNTLALATSGITMCEKTDSGWKLITWNDQSHLAD